MSANSVNYLLPSLIAFLAGAVPTSYLAGCLLRGIDLRSYGSGNLGATNVYRVMGILPALLVLAVDILKGFAPVFWIPPAFGGTNVLLQCVMGVCAVLGHVFSPFVGFRGGKGVATGAGVVLAIGPAAVGICLVVWLIVFAASRIVSLASLAAALALPVAIYFTAGRSGAGFAVFEAFGVLVAAGVFVTHRSNIVRLLRGEEKRLGRGGDLR